MEFEQLITLINTVSGSHLTQFSMEQEGFSITMKTDKGKKVVTALSGAPVQITSAAVEEEVTEPEQPSGNLVKSPLVGTFYNAESPEAAPFVKVGDRVTKGQTLAIVEAMKLMNEIESEFDGIVKEILVENEQLVSYGEPLFVIQ